MLDAKIGRISDICNGKADVDFANALREVIQNYEDGSCDPRAARRIQMTVTFKYDTRNQLYIELDTATKLAKPGARRTIAYLGKGHDGQMGLFTDDPDQVAMFNNLANSDTGEIVAKEVTGR